MEYLEQFYHVYAIDLPGFVPGSEPISEVSLERYADATQELIDALGITDYWMAGLSFGFLVANICSHDKRCFGTVSVVPYINKNYLIKNEWLYFLLEKSFALICKFKWYEKAYRSIWLRKALLTETHEDRVDEILATVSACTFFETALLLFKLDKEPDLNHKPYIFFVTEEDSTIKMDKLETLLARIENKQVVKITCSHHPDEITKQYFDSHVNRQEHERVVNFMLDYQAQTQVKDDYVLDLNESMQDYNSSGTATG